ncbi:DgyrCDS8496 [Dimorphilus gyrociliatus]|uniref:DgyrCDS8496 n=1 Tax=Dimorphilus gyrociliatus TaxID=2664684 RepID=A0A7I8VVC4_9ANNE|nr:DgyrCDS8496 [Dimorphilus gyrociliatus]
MTELTTDTSEATKCQYNCNYYEEKKIKAILSAQADLIFAQQKELQSKNEQIQCLANENQQLKNKLLNFENKICGKHQEISKEKSDFDENLINFKFPFETTESASSESSNNFYNDVMGYLKRCESNYPSAETFTDADILRTEARIESVTNLTAGKLFNEVKLSGEIKVPRWRINGLSNCYTMEGIEDITDDSFIKRHLNLEIEEKRRKRWDSQRVRERRQVEHLKQVMSSSNLNQKKKTKLKSFLTEGSNVKYVEICETVPVTAFGESIPKFETKDFNLPKDF